MGIDAAGVVAALRARDLCAAALGIEVLAADAGSATVEMLVRPDMCNGLGTCHGGMIFTLADAAMSYASNSHDVNAFATNATVEFLSPAHAGDVIRATAVEHHLAGRTGIYDVAVVREDGSMVATFRGRTLRVGGSVSNGQVAS